MKRFLARNINILILTIAMTTLTACSSSKKMFESEKTAEFARQPLQTESLLTEEKTLQLPECVRKYLACTGAIGKSIPQNVRIEFDAEMYRKPGDKPMKSYSLQYNFYGQYSRLFLMEASKMGIPFRALHVYKDHQATFQVKVAELFKVVNISGEELTKAETVTLLNDMCIFVPGSLIDSRLTWKEIDASSTKVTMTNGKYIVTAILNFNETGELINFVSDDRSALQDDGNMKQMRWTTPISNYQKIEGRRIPTVGKTIWNYPEGDFTYGVFKLRSIRYNVTE